MDTGGQGGLSCQQEAGERFGSLLPAPVATPNPQMQLKGI